METNIKKITAFVNKDANNVYTIFCKEEGGPIMVGEDLDEVKANFEEALIVSRVLLNLKVANATGVYELEPEIEYVTLSI